MTIETEGDLEGMRRVGRVVARVLAAMRRETRPGVTTAQLDTVAKRVLEAHGAVSAPARHYHFPGTTCISVNDEAVHGIPGTRVLRRGDLVKLDVTAELNGYIADAAVSVALPGAEPRARRMVRVAESAFSRAAAAARAGRPINELGRIIELAVGDGGFAVLPQLFSHGVGRAIHEAPSYPQFYDPGYGGQLWNGLVITIEPIISAGSRRVVEDPDGWTLRTADGSLSAHHEHTIIVKRNRCEIVTA